MSAIFRGFQRFMPCLSCFGQDRFFHSSFLAWHSHTVPMHSSSLRKLWIFDGVPHIHDAHTSAFFNHKKPFAEIFVGKQSFGSFPETMKDFKTVSYTHLRAHETVLDLVCRLLLEK